MVDCVIVAGNMDGPTNGRASLCPRPLWPLPTGVLVSHLAARLASVVDGSLTVCAHGRTSVLRKEIEDAVPMARFFDDGAPRGTAGCLRHCMEDSVADEFIIAGGAVWLDDDLEWMLEAHRRSGNALTVYCAGEEGRFGDAAPGRLRSAGLYVCHRAVLPFIRPAGFQDIKEQLVPRLRENGLRVGSVQLRGSTVEVLDWAVYQRVLEQAIGRFAPQNGEYQAHGEGLWVSSAAAVARSARIVGPCIVKSSAQVAARATIVGPAIIGDAARIGAGAELVRVTVGPGACVAPGVIAVDECIERYTAESDGIAVRAAAKGDFDRASGLGILSSPLLLPAIVVGLFLWSFSSTAARLFDFLSASADYSAGLLIPPAIGYMIYSRKEYLRGTHISFWSVGIVVFLAGAAANLTGSLLRFSSIEYFGLILAAVGVLMSVVGRSVFTRIWIPLAMLVFMVPLPHRLHHALLYPLQGAGARIAGNLLETVGIPTEQFGHVLHVAGQKVAVAEACSGLRLALAFLIVTAVVAYVAKRPRWQKCVVFLSAIPVALACNVLRIALSAWFYHMGYSWLAEGAFHDGAGLFMMPVAMLLIALEFKLLSMVFVPAMSESDGPLGVPRVATAAS